MELQWLLICQAFKFNQENGLLDIAGIFSRATISRDRLELSAAVVAKVKFDILLTSERTTFVLRFVKTDGDWMEEIEMPFVYPTLEQWLQGHFPIIQCSFSDFEFPEVGEYAVEIYHEGTLIGSETFILARS